MNKNQTAGSNDFLQAFLETAVDGIVTIDRHGIIHLFNPAAERMFGFQSNEVIGKNINILMPEPYHSAHDSYLENYLRTGTAKIIGIGVETMGLHKNGSTLPIDLAVSEMNIDGQPMFLGIVRDIAHLKISEKELIDSENRFRQFFDASGEALFIHEDGVILDINPAVTKCTGYKEDEVIGKHILNFIPSEFHSQAITQLNKLGHEVFEIVVLKKDGTRFIAELNGKTVKHKNENVQVVGLLDVNERKRVEDVLRQSEARIRAIVDTAVDGIITIDSVGIVQTFNLAAEIIFGYEMDEVIGQNVKMLMPEPYQGEHDSYLSNFKHSRKAKIIGLGRGVTGKRKDGSTFPMDLAVGEMVDDGGSMYTGIVRDITERKNADLALQSAKDRLSFLFAESPVVTYNCKLHGDLFIPTFVSDNINKLFGYEPSELLDDAQFWINNIHPDDLAVVLENLNELFVAGFHTHTYRFMMKDGRYVWIEDGLRLIYNDDGEPQEIVGYWTNIDERKRQEVELIKAKNHAEKANKAKSEFLSSMSHELRTPLNAILGFSQLLEHDKNLSDKQKNHSHEIYGAGEHLLSLIDEVLDLAKIEAGHVELSMEHLEIASLLQDCETLTQSIAELRGISIEFDLQQCNDIFIYADYTRIKQVILNLLSNAVKYNRMNGSINISCSRGHKDSVRVSINDTGYGIHEDKLARLFQPFNRLGAEFSDIEGTGIGLVITKELIEMMGGCIGVESVPGEGATFWIELKAYSADEATRKRNHAKSMPQMDDSQIFENTDAHPGLILVAEDNVTNQAVIHEQLELLGYTADIVIDGQMAFDQLEKGGYDLLLTDIHMPKMDGFQLVKKIREKENGGKKHLPIIAFTANAMEGEAKRCIKAGMDGFLTKPVILTELQQALAKWMPTTKSKTPNIIQTQNSDVSSQETHSNEAIDLSILRQMVGDDPEMHHQLLEDFSMSTSGIIQEILLAYQNGEAVDIALSAHKLKSSSKAMGASELSDICQGLEAAGKAGDWTKIDALAPQLDDLLASIIAYVKKYFSPEQEPEKKAIISISNIKALVVDDDEFMRNLITSGLNHVGIMNIISAESGDDALSHIDQANSLFDVILCDLNMPGMDGVEFLRHISKRKYLGGIILVSGEDTRILKTAERLAGVHQLNILGTLEKPVSSTALMKLIDKLLRSSKVKTKNNNPIKVKISAKELQQGIENNELVTVYQPKVEIASRKVIGVETLVRWQHPDKGMIMPDVFIPLAEENSLIDELTHVVFTKAMQHSVSCNMKGFDLKVAVNISIDSLHNLDWPDFIVSQITKAGVDFTNVMLEITESRLMGDMAVALEILTRLSLKKIGLSVDDYGTGYSSLEQLQRIPFTEMKIDRAFVNGAAQDPSARTILESSIELARKLNMSVVAEGVENREDWDLVEKLGCDIVQGYFVAKPMPAEQLEKWLRKWPEESGILLD